MVGAADAIYMVETESQQQTSHPNVQRKRKAAATWCARINELAPYDRNDRLWHYALIGEDLFHDWRNKNARMSELLSFARIRTLDTHANQETLAL